jgi:hypothetical protein
LLARIGCGWRGKATKAWNSEGNPRQGKKWSSDEAGDEEMERQPRGLVRGEFYGKRIKK